MINPLILKDTTKEEWQELRKRILKRILKDFGNAPYDMNPAKNQFRELERYENYNLTHIRIEYEVAPEIKSEAVIVLPENFDNAKQYPAVVTIHGTNGTEGKYGVLGVEGAMPNREYAIELAKRGYVTISPDQYGYGVAMEDTAFAEKYENFYSIYPEWSLTGIRLLYHIRCVDVLFQLDYINKDAIGAMGNSLGGCGSMYLTAMDSRINCAVLSTALCPAVTNIYRTAPRLPQLDPYQIKSMMWDGKPPWDHNDILSLCAPRPIMIVEPFNDPYNPYIMVTIDCVHKAWEVYNLLEAPEKLSLHVHGDGHDTVPEVRDMAYNWLDRFLKHPAQ